METEPAYRTCLYYAQMAGMDTSDIVEILPTLLVELQALATEYGESFDVTVLA